MPCDMAVLQLFLCFESLALAVELDVAEIERDVDRDLDEVQNIEEEAEVEDESGAAVADLNYLARDSARVADEQENLKEEALALRGLGNERLADRDRPRETEAEYGQCFKKISYKWHWFVPFL